MSGDLDFAIGLSLGYAVAASMARALGEPPRVLVYLMWFIVGMWLLAAQWLV